MAGQLQFDLVSPERLLVSEQVEQVVVPGAEGYFTVLAGHAPFMTTLKPGLVEIVGAGETQKFFVRGGFADVTPSGLTVLADQATRLEDLNAQDLERQIREAEEDLNDLHADDHDKRVLYQKRLNDLHDTRRWIIPA